MNIIGFYGYTNQYGFLSQHYKSDFVVDNIKYNCTEQYMMAQKAKLFGDDEIYQKILTAKEPFEHKKLGRLVKNYKEDQWIANREQIVYTGNINKFSQNIKLKKLLLETGDAILVEASPYDKIWGVGLKYTDPRLQDPKKWNGLNLLGKILMKVREELS